MSKNSLSDMESELINNLCKVKEDYIATKNELLFSIRRDVVSAQLKDILCNNPDFYQLRSALEDYISKLTNLDNMKENT